MEYPFKDLLPLDEVLAREGYYKDWTHLDPEVFYSLTQISEYIKTKGYGVDVRLLIAQLAEHFGLKTTQVVDLANSLSTKHDALKDQFDVVIRDATSGADWGGEVALARGGKATLGQRLDETTAQLAQNMQQIETNTSQIATLASGSPKAVSLVSQMSDTTKNYVYTGSEGGYTAGHWYYYNGSAWTSGGVYQSTGIADGSVTQDKLSFTEDSKNLFNKTAVTIDRYINTADGALIFSGSFNVSEYIPVLPSTLYSMNKISFGAIHCYDASKIWLGTVYFADLSTTVTLPNTAFIRFTVSDADLATQQLELGTISTEYESYGKKIPISAIRGDFNEPIKTTTTTIVVDPSAGDFTTINGALNSITDATETNRYVIFVKKGTYNETFRTNHWVDIIGEDKYKTIIDYTGDVTTWNDTSTVFAESNMTLSNLTLIGADTKYPLHIDKATGAWDMLVENVRCIHRGSLTDPVKAGTPVGIGLYPYQNLTMIDCDFIYEDVKGTQAFGASGVYFHNISDVAGTGYRKLVVERCIMKGVTYGYRPNAVSGTTSAQKNDAYIVNNDITATHAEYYFPEEETDESWNVFAIGNRYTRA